MGQISIEGIPQDELDLCLHKIHELQEWAKKRGVDRWAFRAALIKALNDDSKGFFEEAKGTFREIAAFDNGVANALESEEN